MNRIPTAILMLLSALACLASGAAAQTLQASVKSDRVYVGDQFIYNIILSDANTDAIPTTAFPAGVRAEYVNFSQNAYVTTRRQGGQTQRVTVNNLTHQYRVTALTPGVNTIPPATLTLPDGSILRTQPVRFEALLPEPAPDAPVEISATRTTLYAGESVEITIAWTMPESVRNANFDTSDFPASLNPTPIDIASTRSGRIAEFEFRGHRALGLIEQVFSPAGFRTNQFRFKIRISPTTPGDITLGPIRVVFNRARSVDGWARAYAESEPLRLTVLPVPTENKPDNFTGLIGSYALRALANPTSANVGDPITLRVELLANEPLPSRNPLPDLEDAAAFDNLFRHSPEGWTEQTPSQAGKRIYTTTVRALTDRATEIPPVEISTFDPESGTYTTVRSDPIQLDIRAVREATIADAIVTPGLTPRASDARRSIDPADPAFWAAPSIAQIDAAQPFALAQQLRRPIVIAAITTGPAALFAAVAAAMTIHRRRDPARVRDRKLRRAEHSALRSAPTDAVRAAAAAALDCNPDAVALADLDRLPAHPGIVRTLKDALAPAESPKSNTPHAPPVTAKDTRLAIRALRNTMRKQPITHDAGRELA